MHGMNLLMQETDEPDDKKLTKIINQYPLLTASEERELLAKKGTEQWDDAREKLVLSNLRLIASVASSYGWIEECDGDFEDILMHGIIGFMIALERFKLEKESKLSTYATYWINQEIQNGLVNKRGRIKLPQNIRQTAGVLWRAEARLLQDGVQHPTYQMLSEETGIPLKRVRTVMDAVSIMVTSMNTPVGEDDGDEFGDFIGSPVCVEDEALKHVLTEKLLRSVAELPETERRVILMRYGFEDGYPKTLEECSMATGLSCESCRKIQLKAEMKLKKNMSRMGLAR